MTPLLCFALPSRAEGRTLGNLGALGVQEGGAHHGLREEAVVVHGGHLRGRGAGGNCSEHPPGMTMTLLPVDMLVAPTHGTL